MKSKRGFSLIEVLVAVAIIGIISAIAVPQFTAQRKNAAKVASDTSAGNIAKAFKHCVALKAFTNCDSLSDIKVSCPAGSTCESGGAGGKFCAHLHKGDTGSDFKVCISVDGSGDETRTYAGELLKDVAPGNRCHKTVQASSDNSCQAKVEAPVPGLQACVAPGDCGNDFVPEATDTTSCGHTFACKPLSTTMTATCDDSTGNCS